VTIVKEGQHLMRLKVHFTFGMVTQPCSKPADCDCGGGYVVITVDPPNVPDALLVPVSQVDRFIAMIEQNRAQLLGQVS
jgi:hypothetical protein